MGKRTTFLVQVISTFHLRPISYLAVNVVAPPILWLYFFSIPWLNCLFACSCLFVFVLPLRARNVSHQGNTFHWRPISYLGVNVASSPNFVALFFLHPWTLVCLFELGVGYGGLTSDGQTDVSLEVRELSQITFAFFAILPRTYPPEFALFM